MAPVVSEVAVADWWQPVVALYSAINGCIILPGGTAYGDLLHAPRRKKNTSPSLQFTFFGSLVVSQHFKGQFLYPINNFVDEEFHLVFKTSGHEATKENHLLNDGAYLRLTEASKVTNTKSNADASMLLDDLALRDKQEFENKKNYLEHPILAAPVAPPGQQVPLAALAAHAAWVKGQKEVVVLMLLTMDLEIQRNLAYLGAYDMLQELKAMYSKQAEQELLQTVRKFHTSKQEEGQSVSSHVLKMKGYIENLERLGQPVGQNLAEGFRKTRKINRTKLVREVMVKVKARWAMLKTMPNLLLNLRLLHHLRKITLQRMPFSTNVVKLGIGEGTGLRGSKKLKPGALSLYVGDGHHTAVEAIGTYYLELPNGLVIVLNNCHYDPSITRGYPKETMRYSFYSPSENKVFVARNAEFFESKLLDLKASGSVEDLELIQKEDTNPSVDTSLDHEKDD
nr:zinc finger, CCHC-type [Tanacetum cinerariifolium]